MSQKKKTNQNQKTAPKNALTLRHYINLGVIFLLLCLLGYMAFNYIKPTSDSPTAQENNRALIGGPFTLVDHTGKTVQETDYAGKYMLVYFGYTFCPDVCPTDLQAIADSLDMLPEEVTKKITPLFISIDPERDTVDIMKQYIGLFHPQLIGLTGSVEQVNLAKKSYRVWASKEENDGSSDYLVNHTSYIYLMDPDGLYVTHYRHGVLPNDMAASLRENIK